MKPRFVSLLVVIFVFLLFVYLNNTSRFFVPQTEGPFLVAHRGLGQTFPMDGIAWDTNTASRVYPPEHPYLENTLPSMKAAFAAGADIVELDIHPTVDGHFAVFHDWIVDYRTDGEGLTREHTLAELKRLDIGFGYTADGGETYPFRGKGTGLLPSLDEVLTRFPEGQFLIHIKSNEESDGVQLAEYLKTFPEQHRNQLAVYGGNRPVAAFSAHLPNVRTMSRASLQRSLLAYMAVGWTGFVPASARNTQLHVPLRYARFLWGWPHRLVDRMSQANTRVIVVLGDGTWSEGFDTPSDLTALPESFAGGIWTNRIDRIGPIVSSAK